MKGVVVGAINRALFPLTVMPTRTLEEPTCTVIVPWEGKARILPPGSTALTSGTGDDELVIWTQQGPEVATATVKCASATAYEALLALDPADCTAAVWRCARPCPAEPPVAGGAVVPEVTGGDVEPEVTGGAVASGELRPAVAGGAALAAPGSTTRRMRALASRFGLTASSTNPASTAATRTHGDPGDQLERGRRTHPATLPGQRPTALAELVAWKNREGAGGRSGRDLVPRRAGTGCRGRPSAHPRDLAGLGECPQMVGAGGHGGHHTGHRLVDPGPVRRRRSVRGSGPGVDVLECEGIAVETEEGCVPAECGDGNSLVGKPVQLAPLERLDLGDRPAQAVVDRKEIQPAVLASLPELLPDRLGGCGGRLLLLVVATASGSASGPHHLGLLT